MILNMVEGLIVLRATRRVYFYVRTPAHRSVVGRGEGGEPVVVDVKGRHRIRDID